MRALITGITGQDGSYLAEFLLSRGYEVHGLVRRSSVDNLSRIRHLLESPRRLELHAGDVTCGADLFRVIGAARPDEVYHLAAQSHVGHSFEAPLATLEATGLSTVKLLEAVRHVDPTIRLYFPSTCEMLGHAPLPHSEKSEPRPPSPYAVAKLCAHRMLQNYRSAFGLRCWAGISSNHESPRRGPTFVTRKITRAISAIRAGRASHLRLGSLDARRDWGYAPEYVALQWRMLQTDPPDDYVLGTGVSHSVEEFARRAFEYAGLRFDHHVQFDPDLLRPAEIDEVVVDDRKARSCLDWHPRIDFEGVVEIMVDADLRAAGLEPVGEGDALLDRMFPDRWWQGD